MTYGMFLDDERLPSGTVWSGIFLVRTVREAIHMMEEMGCPNHIDFDNDLGLLWEERGFREGRDLANWLVERDLDMDGKFIPENFTYAVHSQNPIARDSITDLLNRYISQKAMG